MPPEQIDVVVYHDNCHDGVTAAAIARMKYPDARFVGAKYQDDPDALLTLIVPENAHVLFVDFSMKFPDMEWIAKVVASLTVFDHHVTAEKELAGLVGKPGVRVVFDMERSGAGITWDELFPDRPRPALVDHVEDRDLWRFAHPGTRAVHMACNSYPLDIETRIALLKRDVRELLSEGEVLQRYHNRLVDSVCRHARVTHGTSTIALRDCPIVCCPIPQLVSDVGHALAPGHPMAIMWAPLHDKRISYSLRSAEDGIDVAEFAAMFGGGGHRHAAGFTADEQVFVIAT